MFDSKSKQTPESPTYDPRSGDTLVSLVTGAVLMFLTISGMLLVAGTSLGSLVSTLYSIPIVGVAVFGGLITLGRYLGIRGVKNDKKNLAIFGTAMLVFAYAWFGGGIMHPYSSSIYLPAILITGIITTAITLIAGAYVYMSDKDLSHWSKYSRLAFVGAIVSTVVGSFIKPVLLLAFVLAMVGFIADLVYEIWMTSNSERSPYVNGIAIYVAFAGVFVHVLQLVLEALAEQ